MMVNGTVPVEIGFEPGFSEASTSSRVLRYAVHRESERDGCPRADGGLRDIILVRAGHFCDFWYWGRACLLV